MSLSLSCSWHPARSLTGPQSLDAKTDELIRGIIREKFQYQTVITVTHSVEHLLECDKVMVIDQGQVIEFDAPGESGCSTKIEIQPDISMIPQVAGDPAREQELSIGDL